MKTHYLVAAAIVSLAAGSAHAQTVSNTSLQDIDGVFGSSVATTTTNATGTRTTVVGDTRVTGIPTEGQWYQANVGGGGTVGITTTYARSGNGSAYFATTGGASKGDLQYKFGEAVPLSSLTSVSYDFYRSGTSTTSANFAPVLRFDVLKNNRFAGSLVLENIYQTQQATPVDTWTMLTATA